MKKKILGVILTLVLAMSLLLVASPIALALQEGPGIDWWLIDATTGVIEIDGDPNEGQVVNAGTEITITGPIPYAISCAGEYGPPHNEAWTGAWLELNGPGVSSLYDDDYVYDYNNNACAESYPDPAVSITYTPTIPGEYEIYMVSIAWVNQYDAEGYVAYEEHEDWLTFEVPIEVDIDIKPGSDPNSINLNSKGVIPVAILGSAAFDVTTVDVTTLAFGPSSAAPAHDLTDPVVYAEHLQDVNSDGFTDLVSHYRTQDASIASGDTFATLTGQTTGGILIIGTDAVRIAGK